MSQMIANPEEMKKFAQQLKSFSAELHSQLRITQGKMQTLGQTWRDQEHIKFSQNFTQSIKPLHSLITNMEDYSRFLMRKADAIKEYERLKR